MALKYVGDSIQELEGTALPQTRLGRWDFIELPIEFLRKYEARYGIISIYIIYLLYRREDGRKVIFPGDPLRRNCEKVALKRHGFP